MAEDKKAKDPEKAETANDTPDSANAAPNPANAAPETAPTPVENANSSEATDPNAVVKIKLFKDGGQYKEDLFVAVNGRSFLIQRGVEVEVPAYVAEVLEHSMSQDQRAQEMVQTLVASN